MHWPWKALFRRNTPVIPSVAIAVATMAFVFSMEYLGALQWLELRVYDQQLALRPTIPRQSYVSFVTVTEPDLKALKRPLVPDGLLAELIENLLQHKPRAIGLDLYRDMPIADGTDVLAALLNGRDDIFIARKYGDESSPGIPAPDYLSTTQQAGCTDVPMDSDDRVRRALVYLDNTGDTGQKDFCESMGYGLAKRYLADLSIQPQGEAEQPDSLHLGKASLPRLRAYDGGYGRDDDSGYQLLLDYRIAPTAFPTYTLSDVLAGRFDPVHVRDRIVLIGTDSEGNKDFFAIPDFTGDSPSAKIAGVKLHGLLADQLIRAALLGDVPSRHWPEWLEMLWTLLWCGMGAAVGMNTRKVSLAVFVSIFGLAVNAAVIHTLFRLNYWIPLVPSALGWLASSSLSTAWVAHHEKLERETLMNLFARHVDQRIANEIWRQRSEILKAGRLVPRRLTATVFFSDIEGFTRIAEKLDPDVFIGWLNEYLEVMTALINAHGGIVIRFIGDAIMAGFGVPLARTTEEEVSLDADNAARCALEIQAALTRLNSAWASRQLPVVRTRIGINTGELLAGSLGCRERLDYTIHGDTVNTASRLESFEKEHWFADEPQSCCRILMSENTNKLLGSGYIRRSIGSITFKGKSEELEVFQLEKLNQSEISAELCSKVDGAAKS